MIWVIALAAVLGPAIFAGLAPLWASRVTVFALAGPHNWMEFRFLLAYAPTGAGLRKPFVLVAAFGTLTLAALFASLVWIGPTFLARQEYFVALSAWQTALFLWVVLLLRLKPVRSANRGWISALLYAAAGISWLSPRLIDFAILYLHAFVAFAFLYLAIRRWKPVLLRAYWAFMAAVLLTLCGLALLLWDAGAIGEKQSLAPEALQRAGAAFLPSASNHMLLAMHTFLEILHYFVWLLAIPLIGMRSRPWRLEALPLARKSRKLRGLILVALASSALLVLVLWLAFWAAPIVTFELYFTVAMIHVIAELPCLLRLSRA